MFDPFEEAEKAGVSYYQHHTLSNAIQYNYTLLVLVRQSVSSICLTEVVYTVIIT